MTATVYQLHIKLTKTVEITIGKLGRYTFTRGQYIYTGSAKKNMQARVKRNLSKDKTLRWHIDYLLNNPHASVIKVTYSTKNECTLNQQTAGKMMVAKFGASDCQQGCGTHLKYLGQ